MKTWKWHFDTGFSENLFILVASTREEAAEKLVKELAAGFYPEWLVEEFKDPTQIKEIKDVAYYRWEAA